MASGENPFSAMVDVIREEVRRGAGPSWNMGEVISVSPLKVRYRGVQLNADQVAAAEQWAAQLKVGDSVPVLPDRDDGRFAIMQPADSAAFASAEHDHDSDYAALGHDHDSDYAALGHDHDSDYAALGHDHDSDYLGKTDKAADSDKLDGKDSTAFAAAGHTHDYSAVYLAIAGKAADSSKLDGKTLAQVIADAVAEVNSKNRRVGTLYWTLYNTEADRPATLFGGTWVLLTSGTFPVAGAATGDYIPGDATKGEGGEATHTLSSAEIPAHNHPIPAKSGASGFGAWGNVAFPSNTGTGTSMNTSNSSGGGGAHNNMPPWKAYYIWEKTAN